MASTHFSRENRNRVFEKRLQELCNDVGGQTKLAELTGITRQSIGAYCSGERTPDAGKLQRISERTGVSTDYLLGLSDTKSADPSVHNVRVHTGLAEASVAAYDRVYEKNPIRLPRVIDILMQDDRFNDLMKAILDVYECGYIGDVDNTLSERGYSYIQDKFAFGLQINACEIFKGMMAALCQAGDDDCNEELKKVYAPMDQLLKDSNADNDASDGAEDQS